MVDENTNNVLGTSIKNDEESVTIPKESLADGIYTATITID